MASVWSLRDLYSEHRCAVPLGWILLVIAASLAPHVLTGYVERRYFSLCLFAWSLALALLFTHSHHSLMNRFLAVTLPVILAGYLAFLFNAYNDIQKRDFDKEATFLNALHECHLKQPEYTVIFTKKLGPYYGDPILGSYYGATAGMKTAYIPSNFNQHEQNGKTNILRVYGAISAH